MVHYHPSDDGVHRSVHQVHSCAKPPMKTIRQHNFILDRLPIPWWFMTKGGFVNKICPLLYRFTYPKHAIDRRFLFFSDRNLSSCKPLPNKRSTSQPMMCLLHRGFFRLCNLLGCNLLGCVRCVHLCCLLLATGDKKHTLGQQAATKHVSPIAQGDGNRQKVSNLDQLAFPTVAKKSRKLALVKHHTTCKV